MPSQAASHFRLYEATVGLLDLDYTAGLAVQSFDPGFAEHRAVVEQNADNDGEFDTTAYHGGRVVTLDVRLIGSPEERHTLRSALARFVRADLRPSIRWTSPYYGEIEAVGRITGMTGIIPVAMHAFNVRLVQRCSSGVWQSTTTKSATVRPGSGTTQPGRTYDLTFSRVYPSGVIVGQGIATVAGDTPVQPIIRIYGPITGPDLQIITTGGHWKFAGAGGGVVAAGDYIQIDVANRTAYLNSDPTLSRYSSLDFTTLAWKGLAPGTNIIKFDGASVDTNTNAIIEWRDSYL